MSALLAKIFGIYFASIGFSILFNPSQFKSVVKDLLNDRHFLFLSGIMSLFIGAFVVSAHNIWTAGWPVIVTIIGWWGLAKGLLLLCDLNSVRYFSFIIDRTTVFYRALGAIELLIGAFLLYHGIK